MNAKTFYYKRLEEDNTIGSVQLMEEYAKHIIEINFCDGCPIDFEDLTTKDLKRINQKINTLVDWVNS